VIRRFGIALAAVLACGRPAGEAVSAARSEAAPASAPATPVPAPAGETRHEEFELVSPSLSAFWGEDIPMRAWVVVPPAGPGTRDAPLPLVLSIHGFGGDHRSAGRQAWPELRAGLEEGTIPRMLFVFLDASFRTGHHVFADSANNGPWGRALTEELIPALEARYGAGGRAQARFLTGHSSGGWSALWLQVAYPDFFGGTWPTAPDPVDFRNFTGIDLYAWDNAYRDPNGDPIQLWREGDGWRASFEDYTRREVAEQPIGGQIYSFDAVFGPRRADGSPAPMFDRETGRIDREVVEAWKPYDISLRLRERWGELEPTLRGKLHVFVGTRDSFRLDESLRLFEQVLRELGSDARVTWAEGRDHFDLDDPHPQLWPEGLSRRIWAEMWTSFSANASGG
jgi:hypothetical protein